jgi:uncharacterized membrane protein
MKNPIKYSFKTEVWPLLILLFTVILSAWAYNKLPDLVVSHWNFYGQADGWSQKGFQAFLFPSLLVFMYILFRVLPKFDPMGERYQEFAGIYLTMRNTILFFLFIVFAVTTFANLGYAINIGAAISGAVGLLMIILGTYFRKIKRNFFVGIRTPWTISSEYVWNETHRLGSYLFIIWGLGLILAPWLAPVAAFFILFGGIIAIIASLFIYSYWLYKKEKVLK